MAEAEKSEFQGGNLEVVQYYDIDSNAEERVIPMRTSRALLTFEGSCGTFQIYSDQRPANFFLLLLVKVVAF